MIKRVKKRVNKLVALFCPLAIVLPFLVNGLPAASAAPMTATELVTYINAVPGLGASETGSVVTVSGIATRNTTLTLDIDSSVTVNWQASLSGSIKNDFLLTLAGEGTFNFNNPGVINNSGVGGQINVVGAGLIVNVNGTLSTASNGMSLNVAANGVTVNVNAGGSVENSGSNSAINVTNNITGAVININGGSVISKPSGYAINDGGGVSGVIYSNNTQIYVNSGLVEAGSACAIRSSGQDSVVTVSGGTVCNAAASNTNSTIYMNGGVIKNIYINGGVVETTNPSTTSYVVQTTGDIDINGGRITAIKGRAINLVGMDSVATVTGGIIETDSGTAICTATSTPETVENTSIIIRGGEVRATGTGTAVRITGACSTVFIESGLVTANSGFAVDASSKPGTGAGADPTPINVSGGFVFAWGNAENKVVTPITKREHIDPGIIVAWDTTTGSGIDPYIQNTTVDIVSQPSSPGIAYWDNDPPSADYGGIRYENGTNKGFFPLNVTVIQNAFILTIINGTSGGETSLVVKAGTTVDIVADDEIPVDTTLSTNYAINGNKFDEWVTDGGGSFVSSTSTDTSFTMPSSDVTITALFLPRYYFIVYNGTIQDSNYSNTYGYYAKNEVITVRGNSFFPGWNYGDTSFLANTTALETTFTMPDRVAYIGAVPGTPAPPSHPDYTLTVSEGLITHTTGGLYLGMLTTYTSQMGTGLIIVAEPPPPGEEFDCWTIDSPPLYNGGDFFDSSSPTTTFILPDNNATVTAKYKPKTYTLTIDNGTGIQVDVGWTKDDPVTLDAGKAPDGMKFTNWSINSGGGEFDDATSKNAVFTMPDSDASITAHFEWIEYNLTVISGIDGYGQHAGQYHYSDDVTIIADDPPRGKVFAGWSTSDGGMIGNARSDTTTFIMPDRNVTVTAIFADIGTSVDDPPYIPPRNVNKAADEDGTGNETEGAGDAVFPFTKEHIAYIFGYPDATVRPGQDITRAEAAVIFHRLLINELHESIQLQENPFSDVRTGSWYNTAVSAISELGIVNGYPDGTFRPNGIITRAELATIAAHIATMIQMPRTNEVSFSDVAGHWAEDEIMYSAEIGWSTGFDDETYRPDQNITRAEFITLVNKVLERVPETANDLLEDGMIRWIDNSDPDAWYYLAIQEATNTHAAEYKETTVQGLQFEYEYWVEILIKP